MYSKNFEIINKGIDAKLVNNSQILNCPEYESINRGHFTSSKFEMLYVLRVGK